LHIIQHAEDLNQEQNIAKFNKEAGDARKDAADALERAAKAEENLGNAKKDAALALQHAAEANRIAEEERLKRVQIEERMKPRSLNLSPQAISAIKAFKGTEYTFSGVFGDEESVVCISCNQCVRPRTRLCRR